MNVANQSSIPEISIVVPAYNEELRLPPTLISMIDYFSENNRNYEILVIDDGSSDRTVEMVDKFSKLKPQIRVISLKKNSGKGCAVRRGVLEAVGEFILFADADGATPIEEIERLEGVLRGGSVSVAIGSRALPSKETNVATSFHRRVLGQSFNRIVNFLVLPGIRDTQCGFKMFTRKAARFLFSTQKSNGFSFDVEILFLAKKVGLEVVEVPVNWTNIPGSKVNLVFDALRMFRDCLFFKLRHRRINTSRYEKFEETITPKNA